ncbi:hypothetical protein NM208_g6034 [Fusarium decemcellulare]|uniref:Uncharacterized protein n=1 Tax=Fusarium decemcellulare TaxID=57161 RepID=A0ACC1SEU0_9HYPO|nr:hypothetical protein NM208_g6034 [Fusarium decemcellulare]
MASTPSFELPSSTNVVGVSVIDSTSRLRVPMPAFVKESIPGHEFLDAPAYSFLVEHASGQNVLFDLALRKDMEGLPPAILEPFQEVAAKSGAHGHIDHTGDPSTFPASTCLVVGPGFKDTMLPGYPANPKGLILESDYQGRDLVEINFETHPGAIKIGGFRAVDYFQDGSFYLLDAPGHTVGHMSALARTTPTTFILMGGDSCHHCASLRPTQYLPLPNELSPSPVSKPPFRPGSICPGEVFVKIHPEKAKDKPFYQKLSESWDRDVAEAEKTLSTLTEFDAKDEVFVVLAHDNSLLDVIDFFPKRANDWKEKGWKEESRWRFLKDFQASVEL